MWVPAEARVPEAAGLEQPALWMPDVSAGNQAVMCTDDVYP